MSSFSFLLALQASFSLARLLHSLPDDPYAYPKFRVSFLNASPVLNHTVQHWLQQGIRGGLSEFLDLSSPAPKEISGVDAALPLSFSTANYTLEQMKIGPHDSYICFIPKPPDNGPTIAEDESISEISPTRSWSLLQALTGTCLYHRQGWFTYSYCHNREIRQFKELIQANPHHIIGGYKPEEDPEWEAYTLGKAPTNPESGADLTVAEQNAHATNLQLARNAGSRYLVQRWGDGTICDKTGKKREVEVQFHCSMTMTDTILFVKETKTCSYVLVIHTPRLCGEPGFRSRLESSDETQITCREIISNTLSDSDPTSSPDSPTSTANTKVRQPNGPLPVTDYPLKSAREKVMLPPPSKVKVDRQGVDEGAKDKVYEELVRKTLEALFGADIKPSERLSVPDAFDDPEGNEVVIELLGDTELFDQQSERLADALRAGGYNVRSEKLADKEEQDQTNRVSTDDTAPDHEEL